MFNQKYFVIIAIIGLSLSVYAQDKKEVPIQVRAIFHDPLNPTASLFYTDEKGILAPLNFRPKALTRPMLMLPINGLLTLYDKAKIDPQNPAANLVASIKLPSNTKKVIVLVIRGISAGKKVYKMLLIDDSKKSFPKGESRVISLTRKKTTILAGEHKLSIHPGKITRVPPVKRVNKFNMAQTNFYYQGQNSWMPFTERQLQYIDAQRRLFIVYRKPGVSIPTVTTIVDITNK